MNDPFHPCRLAALKSIMLCKDYFEPRIIASQVLPCVVPHLMDATSQVRKEAFAVLDQFTVMLRTESDRMETGAEVEEGKESSESTTSTAPGSTSTSYISGITSWMTSHAKAPSSGSIDPAKSMQSNQLPHAGSTQSAVELIVESQCTALNFDQNNVGSSINEADGWLEDENILEEEEVSDACFDGLDDGRMAARTSTSLQEAANKNPLSSLSLKESDVNDFFSSSMVGTKKIGGLGNPAIVNRPMPSYSNTLSIPNKKKQSLAERKAEFSQRKAAREKTSKQPTTIGVKKLTDDVLDHDWDDF